VAKRQPVDGDCVVFSKYYGDVRAEMLKANSAVTRFFEKGLNVPEGADHPSS
jgi:hypothetical protein